MDKVFSPGVYGILTDPVLGYERVTEAMVEAGVSVIQLRMKDVPDEEVVACGRRLRRLIPSSVAFIVNDSPEIAMAVEADGVHLGQTDMDYREARRMTGDAFIIGVSTHNPVQTVNACRMHPDYIGVGPVFATPTKRIPDPAIGISGMKDMLSLATVPAVCLGGINHDNVDAVVAAGAEHICAVRCVNGSKDPLEEIRRLQHRLDVAKN